MDIHSANRKENSGFASGVKTAVFVVVLGTIAAVADHAFFVAPHAATRPVIVDAQPAAVANASTDGYALPPEMHPTAADVPTPPPTF